jgi:hypothetical protein
VVRRFIRRKNAAEWELRVNASGSDVGSTNEAVARQNKTKRVGQAVGHRSAASDGARDTGSTRSEAPKRPCCSRLGRGRETRHGGIGRGRRRLPKKRAGALEHSERRSEPGWSRSLDGLGPAALRRFPAPSPRAADIVHVQRQAARRLAVVASVILSWHSFEPDVIGGVRTFK